jgi:hypothetical protein
MGSARGTLHRRIRGSLCCRSAWRTTGGGPPAFALWSFPMFFGLLDSGFEMTPQPSSAKPRRVETSGRNDRIGIAGLGFARLVNWGSGACLHLAQTGRRRLANLPTAE